jgi:hypothetical protein
LVGIRERPDQEPERADEIGPIRIVDNGSETVHRVKGAAHYVDHLETRSLA